LPGDAASDRLRLQAGDPRARPLVLELHGRLRREGTGRGGDRLHAPAGHPRHLRKAHGRHLLTSLSAKLAILGPPHLVAEVAADNAPARALFKACGWGEERTYFDLVSG